MNQSERIFRVHGRVVDETGAPVEGVWVALADADWALDDFLGAGITDTHGRYELSFARDEFNREALEAESVPDLYAVVSVMRGEADLPIARHVFAPPRAGAPHALEDIRVEMRGGDPRVLADQKPFPGLYHPSQRRLRIDRELLDLALAEVVPRVEQLTGWTGLLDGITVVLKRDYDADRAQQQLCERLGVPYRPHQPAKISDALAFYDSTTHTIVVCDEIAGRYGYETLKQILGHELVHVGQFTRHAELSRRRDDLLRRGLRMHPPQTSDEFSEDMLSMAAANWRRGMTFLEATVEHRRQAEALEEEMFLLEANLESYARYIERDFLGKRSVCDHIPSPPSVFDWVRERLGESRETPAAAASAEAPPGAGASPPGEPAMEPVLSTEQMAVMPLPAGSGTFVTMGIVDLTPPSVTVVVAPLVGTTHVEMVPLSGPGEADEEPLPLSDEQYEAARDKYRALLPVYRERASGDGRPAPFDPDLVAPPRPKRSRWE